MPFLIGFSSFKYDTVKNFVANQISSPYTMIYDDIAQERLYRMDPMNHIKRLTMPTLLAAADRDESCPAQDIKKLYELLNTKKKYIEFKNCGHGFTEDFKKIASEWLLNL